jgi:FG-GAP-like repeat/IPT/TIG domain
MRQMNRGVSAPFLLASSMFPNGTNMPLLCLSLHLNHRRRSAWRTLWSLAIAALVGVCGCGGGSGGYAGGGGGSSGGGNGGGGAGSGGGGGNSIPSIVLLSPSRLMVGVSLGLITVFGSNFTPDAQVYIDGVASSFSSVGSSNEVQAQVPLSFDQVAATHTFAVHQASGTSNSATFVVYDAIQGPQPFNAVSGYFPNGGDSSNLTMCDVNGDGYADAVMPGPTINNAPSLAVMLGGPNGQLAPPAFTPGLNSGVMVCGDVDNDSNPDIVSAGGVSASSPIVSVFLNDGKGNFRQGPTVPYTGNFAASLKLVDMDGDGKLDLVFLVQGSLLFFKNVGGGAFVAPVVLTASAGDNTSLVISDFNEDGKPDIAYAAKNSSTGLDEMHLLINQGGGAFLDEVAPGITGEAGYFAAADFNRDGHTDLVVEQEAPFISVPAVVAQVFLGQGNGTFVAGPAPTAESNAFQTFQLVAGDFDHDGNPDIAGENGDTEPGHVVILWGDGTGNFTRQQVNGPQGFSLTTGDVNGDGIPDILVPDRFGIISVILGQNNRNFPSPNSFTPNVAGTLSAGDVTGNHELDLLSPGSGTPPNQPGAVTGNLYLNNGSGQFGFAGNGNPPSQGFALADLNGDGLTDLIGTDGTNILIWPGTGNPNFSAGNVVVIAPGATAFSASALQIADMDADGRPDLVMPNMILYNEGSFQFTAVPVTFGYTNSPFVIGDFNHDGLLDIAMGAFTLLGQPGRTFRQVTPNGLNMTGGNYAAVGDLNGDGFPDIVFGGNSYPLVIEYGRGDGTFYEQSELPVGPGSDFSQSIAVVDVNGDGHPDIVGCLFLSEQCVIYTNDGQGGFMRSYFASGANAVNLVVAPLKGNGTPSLAITNYAVDYRPPDFLVVLEK